MDDNTANFVTTADTVNQQAGGSSFLDEAGDALTLGVGAAVVSGLSSIYNTGVDVSNYFGNDAERIDIHKALSDVDANWGDYYEQHQGVIDTAGFLATSFIPGGLAVKGLNMVRRGEAAGAFARALNYSTEAQKVNLEAALQTIASPEGSVFSRMNANYLKAIAWGTADQVLQTATFEIAVAATMKADPLLDGQSWRDMSHDIVKNALVGGAFGGGIETLFMNSIVKDATRTVTLTKNKYTNLGGAGGLGLGDADTAFSYIDAAMKLPQAVEDSDKALSFAYQLNGKQNVLPGGLQTGDLYSQALQKTVRKAYIEFESKLTNGIGGDDSTVGQALAKSMLQILKDGKAANLDDDVIRSRLGDYLFNLDSAEGIGNKFPDVSGDTLYALNKKANIAAGEKPFIQFKSNEPAPPDTQVFRVKDPDQQIKIATLGSDAKSQLDAWNKGFDMVIKSDGTMAINPKSTNIRPSAPPSSLQTILNVKTGLTADNVVPTVADIATADSPLVVTSKGVTSGDRTWNFSLDNGNVPPVDAASSTARHLWASKLQSVDGTIDSNDFSVLDRMSEAKNIIADDTMIKVGDDVRNWRDWGNFDKFVLDNKIAALRNRFDAGVQDIPELAYEVNASPDWVQNVVANKFSVNTEAQASNAAKITSGFQEPLADYAQRQNVVLNYRRPDVGVYNDVKGDLAASKQTPIIGNAGGGFLAQDGRSFITGQQAYNYRVKLAKDNTEMAFSSVFGDDAKRFFDLTDDDLSKLADGNDSGAGLVSFSNANYGDKLRLFEQETGKQVHLLSQEIANANLARLQPFISQFKNDPQSAAELTAITTKLRRSSEKYTLLGPDYGLDASYLVDRSLLRNGDDETLAAIKDAALTNTQGGQKVFKIENQLTTDFLQTHMDILDDLNAKRGTLATALGMPFNRAQGTLYVPPVDTAKVPYHAFVVPQEGRIFANSEGGMITARSADELKKIAAQIDPDSGLQVIYKSDTAAYYKAKGLYDYDRGLNDNALNSALRSDGKLGDYLPSFNTESTLEDFLNFHQRQAVQLVRDGVSTKYAQTIAELQRQSDTYTEASRSMFGDTTSKLFQRGLKDPYDDVIKGMLDISKRSEFTILQETNEMLDAVGTRAYRVAEDSFKKAAAGTVSWEEANSTLTKYGLGAPFTNQMAFDIASSPADRNLLKIALQKANMVLSNSILRFDAANSLINIISTPIMLGTELSSIKNSIQNNPELVGKLAKLTSLDIPGGTGSMPSMVKTISEATKDWWGPDKDALIARFTKNGDINGVPAMFHEMTNDLSLVPGLVPQKYAEGVQGWVEKTAKMTGNTWAEQFTRFVSANTMKRLTDPLIDAGEMSVKEQDAFISVFVNRVQGNYIASQRPILFQGTLGSALGLFQTYQFNMMQQLFRHIENRDMKTVAIMQGLQTSVYGLNGLPLFDAINTNLLGNAAINDGHKDVYSYATQAAGKDLGNWMMYGTASALPLFNGQGPSLYTRGDVNPRHPTVVPVNPMDIPAIDGTVRFVKNLIDTGIKLINGGAVVPTLLEGLEHNSLNRPLAGLGQVLNGYATTGQGSLISQSQDLFSIANAGRILGAKPLDESIALNTKFRIESYKAEDKQNLEELGAAVKTKLRNNEAPSDDDMQYFMGRYAAVGGQVQNFGAALQRWSRDANASVINTMQNKVKSPYGQRLVDVMGGTRLPDFRNEAANPPLDPGSDPTQPQ